MILHRLAVAVAASGLLAAPATAEVDAGKVGQVIVSAGLSGDVLIAGGSPTDDYHLHPEAANRTWRWASVTKQVVAVLIMQDVAAGRLSLDSPVKTYLPGFNSTATIRQLLQHQSGLPNADDTAAGADDFPPYHLKGYRGSRDPLTGYCAGPVKAAPGGQWTYNNCDYIVLGAVLEAVNGKSWQRLVRERIARPLGLKTLGAYPGERATRSGTFEGRPEPALDLASFGAAAGLYGSPEDLAAFDKALLAGKLLHEAARATLWDANPKLGYMALGQWVFDAPLSGCTAPVRIVERRGGVGAVEVRNFILPQQGLSVIVFSDRAPFEFGEIWQGKGFSHALLSAAACPVKP